MSLPTPYDYIIAGAGAAGLSLAWQLTHSPGLRHKQILLIDRDAKTQNDRTWGYWAKGSEPFDNIASWQFSEAEFISQQYTALLSLKPYQYRVLEGSRFYHTVRQWLKQFPNVQWVQTNIISLQDEADGASVHTDVGVFKAKIVFNSCFLAEALKKAASQSINLKQHFKGWVIETTAPAFAPDKLRLFDFRTPQLGSLRFFYLIPQSDRRALVEYTLFSATLLSPDDYVQALQHYINEVLQIREYKIVEEEWGVIPMTTFSFPRQQGQHIFNIGSMGGASKPSTGYTFRRIQQQCLAVVRQLAQGQPPVGVASPLRNRLYDATLLKILEQKGELGEAVFSDLFAKNPVQRIFKFLDEETHLGEELMLMQTVNKPLFLHSLLKLMI